MAKHIKEAESKLYRHTGFGIKILIDLLLTAFVLCTFALFHHVIPRMKQTSSDFDDVKPVSLVTPTPSSLIETAPEVIQEIVVPEATPDLRTEWQKSFEEYFTDDIVQTANSYSSPNVSVEITTHEETINGYQQTYYVADIHIGQIQNFRTGCASNGYTRFSEEDAVVLDEQCNAIVMINGDFCNVQSSGILVRNGDMYYDNYTEHDICVLYQDGTLETYKPGTYDPEDIISSSPYQIWKFGPMLLESDGSPCTEFNASWAIRAENPRTGIGYYEPGHYCFVVVDGRQAHSRGLKIDEFAQLFADLGCVRAYNLDGGASSVMTYNDALVSQQSSYRKLGDTLYICEIPDGGFDSEVTE